MLGKQENKQQGLHFLKAFKKLKTHFIQYKLLHRRIVNNKLLYKMGLSENDRCLFCKNMVETIERIFIHSKNTRKLCMLQKTGSELFMTDISKSVMLRKCLGHRVKIR